MFSEVPSTTCDESVAASGCNSTSTAAPPLPPASSASEGSSSSSDALKTSASASASASAITNGDGELPASDSGSGSEQVDVSASATTAAGATDAQPAPVQTEAAAACEKKAAAVSGELLLSRRQSVYVNGFLVLYVLLDLRRPLLDPMGGLGEMGLGRGEGGFGLGPYSTEQPTSSGCLPNGNGNQPLIALDAPKVRALLHNVVRALRPYFKRLAGVFDMPLSVRALVCMPRCPLVHAI